MTNLYNELEKLLAGNDQYMSEDGTLMKNRVVEAGLALQPDLIRLLLTHDGLKRNFFTELDAMLIFDKVKFQKFVMNKRFLPDSYTSFKNKIGLVGDEGDFLAESREVVLSFPYKDCVLEGGQTKEDAKRNEVFWNEILAPDEITRLTEPKVLTNFKRFTAEGEKEVGSLTLNDNLIIKGNNLLALHTLKQKYAGQVKLIYIDPPYNTGNDGFQYNDSFNHSSWLTFMRNRLMVARDLLREDGTIFISIDQNEIAYMLILLDEIFGIVNRKNIITIKRGSVTGAKVINPGVVNLTEYVVIYSKNAVQWKPNRVFKGKERDDRYNTFIQNYENGHENWKFIPLLDAFANEKGKDKKSIKKALGSNFEEEMTSFVIDNSEKVVQFASLDENSVSSAALELKRKSLKNLDVVYRMDRTGKSPYYIVKGKLIIFVADRILNIDGVKSFSEPISDIWDDVLPNDLHNEGGVSFRKGKKPEKLLQRILQFGSNEGDLVLDYHLGSGTTAAVAHKMGRRYIGVEQMSYIEDISTERLKSVVGRKEKDGLFDKTIHDERGITKSVNWQGGGEFVYCELAMANQRFVEAITACATKEGLLAIWQQMQESGFLSWKVEPKQIDENANELMELSIADMQKFLLECLDKNMLYIPYSEIDNQEFGVSDADKKVNKAWYNKQ